MNTNMHACHALEVARNELGVNVFIFPEGVHRYDHNINDDSDNSTQRCKW